VSSVQTLPAGMPGRQRRGGEFASRGATGSVQEWSKKQVTSSRAVDGWALPYSGIDKSM
jgi:hypothetical protein